MVEAGQNPFNETVTSTILTAAGLVSVSQRLSAIRQRRVMQAARFHRRHRWFWPADVCRWQGGERFPAAGGLPAYLFILACCSLGRDGAAGDLVTGPFLCYRHLAVGIPARHGGGY